MSRAFVQRPATAPSAPAAAGPERRRREYLSFSPPLIGEDEIAEVVDTLRSDWITRGPKTAQFEAEFAAAVSAPAATALNSCTAALHTALAVSGIGPGDEVITTPLTWAATVNVIEHVRARPVLVDVEPDTLTIDPARIAAAITPRTRAVIPVHYAGHPADMASISALARDHGLLVLEDAAHALPAAYDERTIGSGANPVAFSFYATKNLTTAEGGMLTGEPSFIERARILSMHGMTRDAWKRYHKGGNWRCEVVAPGFKYNMTDIQAALGLCQLRKLAAFQERRRQVVQRYTEAFRDDDTFELPVERPNVKHAWHLYVLRFRSGALRITRDRIIEELAARNIGTGVHYVPVHIHPYYRTQYGYRPESFPVANDNFERMISLPLNLRLTDHDVADVIDAVRDVVRCYRR